MKRRNFIKKAGLAAAGTVGIPYILPTGRLFAATGTRLVNHVVYVLFAGGLRIQESVEQRYLADQGLATEGNVMNNMLEGAAPTSNIIYDQFAPILSQPLSKQGTLFKNVHYQGPYPNHYNGHAIAITGNNFRTGINNPVNPDVPTVFEYYRKHSDPAKSAMNAWWVSNGQGTDRSLNYSKHIDYGAQYGANFLNSAELFGDAGLNQFNAIAAFHPNEAQMVREVRQLLNSNFQVDESQLPGIFNSAQDKELIKSFIFDKVSEFSNQSIDIPIPSNDYSQLNGDLRALSTAWQVLDTFTPELLVVNTNNLDACHSNFTRYIDNLHKADYAVGWLWDKIQSHPVLANDTIMVCMPEHGRNEVTNSIRDINDLGAYDHSDTEVDANTRKMFTLVVGPSDKVVQDLQVGPHPSDPTYYSNLDTVATIAHVLGIKDQISDSLLPGRVLSEAFI